MPDKCILCFPDYKLITVKQNSGYGTCELNTSPKPPSCQYFSGQHSKYRNISNIKTELTNFQEQISAKKFYTYNTQPPSGPQPKETHDYDLERIKIIFDFSLREKVFGFYSENYSMVTDLASGTNIELITEENGGVGLLMRMFLYRAKDINEIVEAPWDSLGEWGGFCTCPDGSRYAVMDKDDYCGSLACSGGNWASENFCFKFKGIWSGRKVFCAAPDGEGTQNYNKLKVPVIMKIGHDSKLTLYLHSGTTDLVEDLVLASGHLIFVEKTLNGTEYTEKMPFTEAQIGSVKLIKTVLNFGEIFCQIGLLPPLIYPKEFTCSERVITFYSKGHLADVYTKKSTTFGEWSGECLCSSGKIYPVGTPTQMDCDSGLACKNGFQTQCNAPQNNGTLLKEYLQLSVSCDNTDEMQSLKSDIGIDQLFYFTKEKLLFGGLISVFHEHIGVVIAKFEYGALGDETLFKGVVIPANSRPRKNETYKNWIPYDDGTLIKTGAWGGSCTCPDGQIYYVGDLMNHCETLACFGGTSGECNNYDNQLWSFMGVRCTGQIDAPDFSLMLIVGKKNLDGTWTLTYDGQPEIFVNRIKSEQKNNAYEEEDRFCLMCNKGYWPSNSELSNGGLSNFCTNEGVGRETNFVESCDYHYVVSEVLNKSGALKCFQCQSGFVVNHESTACELAENDWFIGCRIL